MFDYQKFANDLGMSAEDRAALDGLFGKYPKAGTTIDGFLTAEVETRMAPLLADLKKKEGDLDQQFDTLASIRTTDSAAYDKLRTEMEKTAAEHAALITRVRVLATENGLNADEILKNTTPTEPVVKPTETPFDRKQFDQDMNRMGVTALYSAALAEDIADEHFALTGQRLSRVELLQKAQELTKRTNNPNLGLREAWEASYDIPKIRTQKAEEAFNRRVEEETTKRVQAMRDEDALRTTTSETPHFGTKTPIFAALTKEQQANPVRINGVPEGVSAAVAAYRKSRTAA